MPEIKSPESFTEFPLALIKNMVTLATSGFGVVVALAWNEAVKQSVEKFINPYLGTNSGIVSLFIYAIIMTFLAVTVTMQLSLIEKKMEQLNEKVNSKFKKSTPAIKSSESRQPNRSR